MISFVEFIDRLTDLTKKNQSGFESGAGIVGKTNQCQLELAQYLYSIFEINNNAVDLAAPITSTFTGTSSANGILPYPEDYNHLLSLRYVKKSKVTVKCQRIALSQLGIIEKIPQRKPSLEKDRILYTYQDNGIQVYPETALNFKGIHAKYPPDVAIEYSFTNVGGEPKRTVSSVTDLVWNKNVYNLLLYMVMDKMGLSVRDQLLSEYAQLGIARETVKPNN